MANNNNVICFNGQQHFLAYYMYYNVNIYWNVMQFRNLLL